MPARDMSSTPVRAAIALVAALAVAAVASPAKADGPTPPPQRFAAALPPGLAAALPQAARPQPRAATEARKPAADQWIVELAAPPLARYRGGIAGLGATAPSATGRRIDPASAGARAYESELGRRQAAVIAAAAPGAKPSVEYRTAFNGFAAKLSDEQVKALRATDGVSRVVRESFFELTGVGAQAPSPDTSAPAGAGNIAGSEADLLGLPGGLWRQLGGPRGAGKGVVVGVVDSGVTPDSASFAPAGIAPPPATWHGTCQTGEQFPAESCTNKLVGARWFSDGFGELPEESYVSPRDEAGHGTHVASTAVGDAGVDPLIGINPLGVDRITGIAPAAHLAMYKACWGPGVCSSIDVIAAIDSAVADGVDVLNLSLGSGEDTSGGPTPTEIALLNADAAGVFVAVAAGNAGELEGALGSPATAPWATAVAATTGARTFRTTIEARGARERIAAATSASGLRDVRLVDAASFSKPGDGVLDDPRYCYGGMTPERVRGAIVICEPFAPTGLLMDVLSAAGAAGFVMPIDLARSDDPAVASLLPSLYVDNSDLPALRRIAASGGKVSFVGAAATRWQPHRVAWFSSRGPGVARPDLARPDVAAPGVNVLAAYSPDTYASQFGDEGQERFNVLSGTSMASPIVAGTGALLTQLHPDWSPAAIRSALVTTAQPAVDSDGQGVAPHVAAGGGRIDPNAAARPGLVVAPSEDDYRRFAAGDLAARDLELPSVSLDGATTQITLQRTVTSVEAKRTRWSARVEAPGMGRGAISVSPASFALDPAARQALRIDSRLDRASRAFQDATVVLTNVASGREVRVPVAIHNPGIVDAPKRIQVAAQGAAGSTPVGLGISATVSGVAHGLAAPQRREATTSELFPGVQEATIPVDIAPGTALYSAQVKAHGADPEFFNAMLFRDLDGDGTVDPADPVAEGADLDRTDFTRVDVISPPPGKYVLSVSGSSDVPVTFDLSSWTVADPKPDDPAPGPGIVLGGDPQHAFPLAKSAFDLRWSGVGGSDELRGIVLWYDGDRADPAKVLGSSVVEVTPGG